MNIKEIVINETVYQLMPKRILTDDEFVSIVGKSKIIRVLQEQYWTIAITGCLKLEPI